MKSLLTLFAIITLSSPVFAAKYNKLSGDELKSLYNGTVITGYWKAEKFTQHNCGDGRSIQKFRGQTKVRAQTYPKDDEVCVEDDRGIRCYHMYQHASNPKKLKYKGANNSNSGKSKLTDKSPDWCN